MLDCEIPEVELEDGSLQSVLEVSFPDGQSIPPCCINDDKGEPSVIPCTVTFQSPSPVTFTTAIIFTDGKEKYVLLSFVTITKLSTYVVLCSICM